MMDNQALYESSVRGINRAQFGNKQQIRQEAADLQDNFPPQQITTGDTMHMRDASQYQLSSAILDEFSAGVSTLNSTPYAARYTEKYDHPSQTLDVLDGYKCVEDHYRGSAGQGPQQQGIPFAPFSYSYPNFGTADGQPDYGFDEPGAGSISQGILDQHAKMLPAAGVEAGFQKDLQPIFSGTNVLALEQRPITQSKGKLKNTMWRNGQNELPDDLLIDPRQVLLAGSNIPTDIFCTNGELQAMLDFIGYNKEGDGLSSTTGYGQQLPASKIVGGNPPPMDPSFYDYDTAGAVEPLVVASKSRYPFVQGASGRDYRYLRAQ